MKYFITYQDEYNETLYRYDGKYYYFYHRMMNDWVHAGPAHIKAVKDEMFDINEEDAFLKMMELSAY